MRPQLGVLSPFSTRDSVWPRPTLRSLRPAPFKRFRPTVLPWLKRFECPGGEAASATASAHLGWYSAEQVGFPLFQEGEFSRVAVRWGGEEMDGWRG